jgi:hypothetical protein
MSLFKNATSPSKVGGHSMWYPQEKGDTAKMWGSWDKRASMSNMGKMPRNPGMDEQRNSRKKHDCPFCG